MMIFRVLKEVAEFEISNDGRDYLILITRSRMYDKKFIIIDGPEDVKHAEWEPNKHDFYECVFYFEKDIITLTDEDENFDFISAEIKTRK